MRFVLLFVAAAFVVAPAISQPLLTENFDYAVGDTLTAPPQPWIHHSGSGDSLLVTDDNLTFTGYPLSTGNSTFVEHGSGSREDAHLGFGPESMSSVYSALLVNASSVTTDANGGYFFHLTQEPHSTSILRGRVYLRSVLPPGESSFHEFNFGISKGSGDADIVWDPVVRLTGTTYLLVMKYTFNPGVDDDTVDLYIFEDGDDISIEPVSPDISSIDVNGDLVNAGTINLRQGSDTMGLTVDGISVGTSWLDIVPAGGFPVTVSCTADAPPIVIPLGGGVYIWNLTLENTGAVSESFDLWIFIDGPSGEHIQRGPIPLVLAPGELFVRSPRQQISGMASAGAWTHECNVGSAFPTSEASSAFGFTKGAVFAPGGVSVSTWTTEAEFAAAIRAPELAVEAPLDYVLEGSYPNPFNPHTTIGFSLPESAHVRLVVYDVLGRQVRVVLDGTREAGTHEVVFDAADLPSGTYLYRLETPQGSFVRTMLLAK